MLEKTIMYTIYVLSNMKGLLYKGITTDLVRRLTQHNKNQSKGTRGKGPWQVVYTETSVSRIDARNREKYLKSGVGREYLKLVIK